LYQNFFIRTEWAHISVQNWYKVKKNKIDFLILYQNCSVYQNSYQTGSFFGTNLGLFRPILVNFGTKMAKNFLLGALRTQTFIPAKLSNLLLFNKSQNERFE